MKAVILAAGRGTRMPEITNDMPKCLIDILGQTIIERQIDILLKNNVKKIYVVLGFKAHEIENRIKNFENVEIVLNKNYATTDNLYSLFLTAEKLKNEEFILLNGDTVFEPDIIKMLINKKGYDIAPVDSKYYDLEELKIRQKNKRVIEILPKSAPSKLSDGSTIGIFKFSSKGSGILFNEISELIKKEIKNKWFEFALNNILDKIKMYPLDIHGLKWIEIDTIDDVKKSNEIFSD